MNLYRTTLLYSTIVIGLSSLVCFLAYKSSNPNAAIFSVFTPSISALILTYLTDGKRGLKELFINQTTKKTAFVWLMISLLAVPLIAFISVLASLNFNISLFALRTNQLFPQIIVIILIAFGEEYGWRGFLLNKLMKKMGFFYAGLIVGLIWGVWHFPAYLIGVGTPKEMSFVVFMLWVILGSVWMSWVYDHTRSVFTAILIHIGSNAAFNYLRILPEFTGQMTEFYIFVSYMLVLVLLILIIEKLNRNCASKLPNVMQ